MNRRIRAAAVLLAACASPAFAQEAPGILPPIRVTPFVADCARPVLPSQRLVAAWTGLHNFGQVYAARTRLMTDIGRACQRPGVGRVQVVTQSRAGERQLVASASETL